MPNILLEQSSPAFTSMDRAAGRVAWRAQKPPILRVIIADRAPTGQVSLSLSTLCLCLVAYRAHAHWSGSHQQVRLPTSSTVIRAADVVEIVSDDRTDGGGMGFNATELVNPDVLIHGHFAHECAQLNAGNNLIVNMLQLV